MAVVKDSLVDLERHRRLLEENIKQLRKAVQHWQTWDAEYEALKEEVDSVPEDGSAREFGRIKGQFEGELVDQKEIDDIFGQEKLKSRDQIVNVLDRRIDYVGKSIESLQKQLGVAENKYAAATVISQPHATDEDGEPMTEIVEELDDDDNVLSYRLNTPGQSLPHVQEALKKAGVEDFAEVESRPEKPVSEETQGSEKKQPARTLQPKPTSQPREPPAQRTVAPKKAVSFVEDTKPADEPKPEKSRNAKRVEHIMKSAKEQESISNSTPVIPDDEEPDEAALRQDMLKYSMGEVGAVVAELQLEEGVSDEDDSEFDYTDEELEDDEDEEPYARARGGFVTDDYRHRMLELEQRLGIKSRFTEAAAAEDEDEDVGSGSEDERVGRVVVNPGSTAASSASKRAPAKSSVKESPVGDDEGKKGVRFAQNLDVVPGDEPTAPVVRETKNLVDPLSDVVERTAPPQAAEPKAPRKASRFRKARHEPTVGADVPRGPLDAPTQFLDQHTQPEHKGPEGTTLADKLVERGPPLEPIQSGDFDGSSYHEVADEHQRLRRRFIERQGGFLKDDECPEAPLDESEGGPERMSRFKAARLSRQ